MKIVFMGTPQAAVPCLERLIADGHDVVAVYTQPDRPAGRGKHLTAPPVKESALSHGIPVFQPLKIRTPEAVEHFRSHGADIAVVVAYGRILPTDYLKAFPHGAINVHFSLLPKYRGAAPVNWAIVNGEAVTGATTMKMDEGLDTGDILLQSETAIGDGETSVELMSRLAVEGAELLSATLKQIGSLSPIAQNHSFATLAPIMKKEDGVIDFEKTSEEIARRVRGFQPFPTSFTYLDGKKVTFWRARPEKAAPTEMRPGTVVHAGGGALAVACGGGTLLEVLELQIEGKKRMPIKDFLNGVKVEPGSAFSSSPAK